MYPVHPFPFSTELEGAHPLRFCQRVGSYDRTATDFPARRLLSIAPAHHTALQASMGRRFSVPSKVLPNQTTSLPPEARESIHASVSSAPPQASAHTPPRRVAFLDAPQSNFVSS